MSTQATQLLCEEVERHGGSRHAQVLHVVIGSLLAHQAKQGVSPYTGVDVERMFTAIKMLSERDQLEIAPFVDNWTDAALTRTGDLPHRWADDFKSALGSSFGSKLDKEFLRGVVAVTQREPSDGTYRALMDELLGGLVKLLAVTDPSRFSHLTPIFDLEGARIATLNYDRGMELAADIVGCEIDTGVESWRGGLEWAWNGKGTQLLKLHGSIDWTQDRPDTFNVPKVSIGPRSESPWQEPPAIIFGTREKLRATGPFLAMLCEFGQWLRETDNLIIVGYSLRDDHINMLIRHWLSDLTGKRLTLIDPRFPEVGGSWVGYMPFLRDLMHLMHPDGPATEQPNGERIIRPELDGHHFTVLREGARSGLPKICGNSKADTPVPDVSITAP